MSKPLSELRGLVEACFVDPHRLALLDAVEEIDDTDRQRVRDAVADLHEGRDVELGDGSALIHDTIVSGRVLDTNDPRETAG